MSFRDAQQPPLYQSWAICDPVDWAVAMVKHGKAPAHWPKHARKEKRKAESEHAFLAVLTWPGGYYCFVKWCFWPAMPCPVADMSDPLAKLAFDNAKRMHMAGGPPLLTLHFKDKDPVP